MTIRRERWQGKGYRSGTELGEKRRNEKEIGKRAGERDR